MNQWDIYANKRAISTAVYGMIFSSNCMLLKDFYRSSGVEGRMVCSQGLTGFLWRGTSLGVRISRHLPIRWMTFILLLVSMVSIWYPYGIRYPHMVSTWYPQYLHGILGILFLFPMVLVCFYACPMSLRIAPLVTRTSPEWQQIAALASSLACDGHFLGNEVMVHTRRKQMIFVWKETWPSIFVRSLTNSFVRMTPNVVPIFPCLNLSILLPASLTCPRKKK